MNPIVYPVPVAGLNSASVQYVNYYPNAYSRRYRRHYYYNHPGTVYTSTHAVAVPTNQVTLGPLPEDFLTVPGSGPGVQRLQQEENDAAMAAQLQMMNRTQPVRGRLEITVVRAALNKNYGMTRMDPYVRLHFGQQVFETQTDPNGAKNPHWNKTFYLYQMPRSLSGFHLEIYDERTLTDDERIAWVMVPIPESLKQGESCDKWYNLSGRLGDGIEGSVHIIISYQTVSQVPAPMVVYGGMGYPASTTLGSSMNVVYQGNPQMGQQPPPPPPPPVVTEEDLKMMAAMFPEMEEAVVRSVLEASGNNKEAAVEALLSMQTTT